MELNPDQKVWKTPGPLHSDAVMKNGDCKQEIRYIYICVNMLIWSLQMY